MLAEGKRDNESSRGEEYCGLTVIDPHGDRYVMYRNERITVDNYGFTHRMFLHTIPTIYTAAVTYTASSIIVDFRQYQPLSILLGILPSLVLGIGVSYYFQKNPVSCLSFLPRNHFSPLDLIGQYGWKTILANVTTASLPFGITGLYSSITYNFPSLEIRALSTFSPVFTSLFVTTGIKATQKVSQLFSYCKSRFFSGEREPLLSRSDEYEMMSSTAAPSESPPSSSLFSARP